MNIARTVIAGKRNRAAAGALALGSVTLAFAVLPQAAAQQAPAQHSAAAAGRVLTPRGAWSAQVSYAADDLVTARGSTWRAKVANSDRVPGSTSPSTAAYWEL